MLSVDIYPRHTNKSMGDKCTVPSRALFFSFFIYLFYYIIIAKLKPFDYPLPVPVCLSPFS